MGFIDFIFIFFTLSNVIIILLFWIISFFGSFFFKKNDFFLKNEFYECGFKSFSDFNFKLNVGTFITMLFVILYDIELLFLVPFLLNNYITDYNIIYSVIFLYFCILITFIIDLTEDVIVWEF